MLEIVTWSSFLCLLSKLVCFFAVKNYFVNVKNNYKRDQDEKYTTGFYFN